MTIQVFIKAVTVL